MDYLSSWYREQQDWAQRPQGLVSDLSFNRHVMWQRIDEANERMERESWEATLREIHELDEVPR